MNGGPATNGKGKFWDKWGGTMIRECNIGYAKSAELTELPFRGGELWGGPRESCIRWAKMVERLCAAAVMSGYTTRDDVACSQITLHNLVIYMIVGHKLPIFGGPHPNS